MIEGAASASRRFSNWAIVCLILAGFALIRANLAFVNGAMTTATNSPYVSAFLDFLPRAPRPPGIWPYTPIEEITMLVLAIFSLVASLLAVTLCLVARIRHERAEAYAGPATLGLVFAFLATRLLMWLWPAFVSLI